MFNVKISRILEKVTALATYYDQGRSFVNSWPSNDNLLGKMSHQWGQESPKQPIGYNNDF